MSIKRFPSTPGTSPSSPPYSKAVSANGFVFVSGQVGVGEDGRLVQGGISAEAKQAIENIRTILKSTGLDLGHVVKATVWLTDQRDFEAFNAVYRDYFSSGLPARACVRSDLIGPYRVEIEAIAAQIGQSSA